MQIKKSNIKKDISKKLGQLSRIERSLKILFAKKLISKDQHFVRERSIVKLRQHVTSLLAHYENTYEARKYGYDTVLPDMDQVAEGELKLCIESVDEQISFIRIINEELSKLYLWGKEAESKKPGPISSVLRLSKLKNIIEQLQIFSKKLKLQIDKQKDLVKHFISPSALHYMPQKTEWNASTLALVFERINRRHNDIYKMLDTIEDKKNRNKKLSFEIKVLERNAKKPTKRSGASSKEGFKDNTKENWANELYNAQFELNESYKKAAMAKSYLKKVLNQRGRSHATK